MQSTSEWNRRGLVLFLMLLVSIACSVAGLEPAFAEEKSTAETIPFKIEPPFAWNRTDKYVPPDFQAFFPDDKQAGAQLDQMIDGKLKVNSIDERLALIRRGLRNCSRHRTTLLGQVGNQYIWNRKEQDPRAIELMYHASASDDGGVAHYALYHGPTVVSDRSANLVRMLMEQYQGLDGQMQQRIAWGMRTYGDKEQTQKLLAGLLDDYRQLNDLTVGATLETWQAVFETDPPDLERFDDLGLWIVAFHRADVSATHPRAAEILREMVLKILRGHEDALLEFVSRVDEGHETAVVLVKGLKLRKRLVDTLSKYSHVEIDFNELFTARILQTRRLNELARFLPEGSPQSHLPTYTRPPAEAKYAYQAAEFVAPDYKSYFADDAEAGRQLDDAYANRLQLKMTDEELLDLFRRGQRHSTHSPNIMFGWIFGALGWPRDPRLTEIFYQGLDPTGPPAVRKAALYYGFGLGTKKTKNVLQALYGVYMAPPFDDTTNRNMRSRILWGVRDHEDDKYYLSTLFAQALRKHDQLSDSMLQMVDMAYQQLTGSEPPNAEEYASRGVYLVICSGRPARTLEEAEQLVSRRLGKNEHVIHTQGLDEKGQKNVIVIVRGRAGIDWLVENLKTEPHLPIYFADLLTPELIERGKYFKGFEKYLPAKQGPREE
ncbi:hypothetical protein [Gimesia panareensis]|uniref:hypothetical protein n=1 Tax=Gimesia panareensis TaxID=2527978 RepID=UPI001189ECEC|nr:hypothetical protein [Gimesia panareensis]QDU48987.1 hypothetical protein Pan110_13030 [Gimesia panareensis]